MTTVTRPIANPGTVTWAGEHLLLNLRLPSAEADSTTVSYYRTLYSPAGAGRTALVLADVEGDGWGPDDLRVIFTDNEALLAWIREHVVRRPQHPFCDPSLPVRAASFSASGAVGQEWREVIQARDHQVVLQWSAFEPPLHIERPRGTLPGQDYDIFSLLCPARRAAVEIDGRRAAGAPYAWEVWQPVTGRARSSASISVCEVLIDQPH